MRQEPAPVLTDPRPPRPERQGFAGLWVLLGAGLLTALLLAGASRLAPKPGRIPFDAYPLNSIRRQRPDVVIIGNSMLYTRLAPKVLERLVAPTRVKLLSRGGTQSAVWYAQLKNYVVASGVKVKRVVIFFLDRELTQSRARTQGQFSQNLERVMPGRDPVIDSRLAVRIEEPLDHLRVALAKLAPVGRLREIGAGELDQLAMRLAGLRAGKRRNVKDSKRLLNGVFEVENLRDVDGGRMQAADDQRSFEESLAPSFLPS